MEGLSYWIFLAVMYLLSAFMKKRRQQESDVPIEKKPSIFQNQFFQDLFQDMKEINVESEDAFLEEFDDSDNDEILEEEVDKILDKEIISTSEKDNQTVFVDSSKLTDLHDSKRYQLLNNRGINREILGNYFNNLDDVKRGIIIKEILDKPRALRKNII
tara:strand:+ start:706 stop:1182 length:477 start_codon:yes stop_codon:yes gene_type:complete